MTEDPPLFVLDNSLAMAWCYIEERNDYSQSARKILSSAHAVAPAIWPAEAANALLVGLRRKRITEAQLIQYMDLLGELNIQIDYEPMSRVFGEVAWLAREHGLSVYDATYLDLALRRGIPIATQDKTMLRAAADCGVAIFSPPPGR